MRRLGTAILALAFAAAIAQSPWAHVHLHGYDATHQKHHIGLDALHGHGIHTPAAETRWRSHGADDDAWTVGVRGAIREVAPDLSLHGDSVRLAINPRLMSHTVAADFQERAHGPPELLRTSPRAPPA